MRYDFDGRTGGTTSLKRRHDQFAIKGALALVKNSGQAVLFIENRVKELSEEFKPRTSSQRDEISRVARLMLKVEQLSVRLLTGQMLEGDDNKYLAWDNAIARRLEVMRHWRLDAAPVNLPARTVARQEWRVNGRSFNTRKEAEQYQEKLREHGVPMVPIEHIKPLHAENGAVELVDTGEAPR